MSTIIVRRGPLGHKLSQEIKSRIAITKTGFVQPVETKQKIANSLKAFFQTECGIQNKERTRLFMSGFWASPEGVNLRESLSGSMRQHYSDNFLEAGE
jgi:hypothetical protein